jgi:hypothetical protein
MEPLFVALLHPARKAGVATAATLTVACARSAGDRCGPPTTTVNIAARARVSVQFGGWIRIGPDTWRIRRILLRSGPSVAASPRTVAVVRLFSNSASAVA